MTAAEGTVGAEQPAGAGWGEVLRSPNVRVLAVSRAASKLAQATVSYGAMVYLATQGASQLQISLVAAATYLAALLFGVQGGVLADRFSKRVALMAGYLAEAALCILIPIFLGTGVGDLMLLVFLSSLLMQIISPSLKAAVAIVATPHQLAAASAAVSVFGSIFSAVGSAFLAPLLIKVSSLEVLLFVAAGIYLFGAIRTRAMPAEEAGAKSLREAVTGIEWRPTALSLRATALWIWDHRAVATMILTGAIVVSLYETFSTMVPVYVRDVLDADPTNAVYIFAPAGLGFLIGTLAAPRIMHRFGERAFAVVSLACMAVGLMLLGAIDTVAPIFAPFSPLRLLEVFFGMEINDKVLAAGVIAIPTNFGSCGAGAAVQTFINRRVPVVRQGATFGLQEVQENALTLVAVVALGALANVVGPARIFLLAPPFVIGVVVWLLRYSYRHAGQELTRRGALGALMDDADDAGGGDAGGGNAPADAADAAGRTAGS